MNKNKEPLKSDTVRRLLDKYYSGDTSVDENAAILGYFKNVGRDNVEPDLLDDYDIFMLEEAAVDSVKVPDDLEANLINMIDSLPEDAGAENEGNVQARERRSGGIRKLWFSAGAAAAVALLFAAAWMFNDRVAIPEDTDVVIAENVIERTDTGVPVGGKPESDDTEEQSLQSVTSNGMVPSSMIAGVRDKRKPAHGNRSGDEETVSEYDGIDDDEGSVEISESAGNDGYIVVTDPDEAARIARMALNELGNRLGRAGGSVQEVDSIMVMRNFDRNIISGTLNKFVEL